MGINLVREGDVNTNEIETIKRKVLQNNIKTFKQNNSFEE